MRPLYVAFRYGDRRPFARLVCLLRGGDSAHCEAAERWSDGHWHCVSSSWVDGGVRGKSMQLPATKWRVYRTDLDAGLADRWLEEHDDEPYGWWKLLRFVLPFVRPSWGGPICTEAVARMLGLGHSDSWDLRTLEAAVEWRYGPPVGNARSEGEG